MIKKEDMMKDLGCAIENKLADLQEAIEIKKQQMHAPQAQSGASLAISHVTSEILNKINGSSLQISQTLEQGTIFARELFEKAQQNAKERPWDMVRHVAVCSFAAGLFLSLRRRKHHQRG